MHSFKHSNIHAFVQTFIYSFIHAFKHSCIRSNIHYRYSRLHIFLEYVPGGSISSMLDRFGKFSEEITKGYARQVGRGTHRRIAYKDPVGGIVKRVHWLVGIGPLVGWAYTLKSRFSLILPKITLLTDSALRRYFWVWTTCTPMALCIEI